MATILIIDDEAPVRGYLRRVLTTAGHRVCEAPDGSQGVAALCAEGPDLVVCDLFMPGTDGVETVRALRAVAPTVPILVISGGGQRGVFDALRRAMSLGTTAGLTKPIMPDELIREVDALLGVQAGAPDDAVAAAPSLSGLRYRLADTGLRA